MKAYKIKSIKSVGQQPTVDIEVKSNNHIFYGNGIATSNSHSIEYAKLGEISASLKYHFPLHFFSAYLAYANEKLDPKQEVKEVINDAKNYNVVVNPPHIQNIFDDREGGIILKENEILFGLIDIKGIGLNHIKQLYSKIEETQKRLKKPISNWSWLDLLVNIEINSTVMENLILIGATCGGESRRRKAFEYSIFKKLTDRDLIWIRNNYIRYKSFAEILNNYVEVSRSNGGPATEKRKLLLSEYANSLKNPPYDLSDNPDWIVSNEKQLIGIPLSYSSTETKSIATNMNVADFLAGKNGKITLLVEIEDSKEFTIKNGKNAGMKMAFMKVKDSSGITDACIFSEGYQKHSECIYDGNVVLISASRSTRDKDSLIINSMEQV